MSRVMRDKAQRRVRGYRCLEYGLIREGAVAALVASTGPASGANGHNHGQILQIKAGCVDGLGASAMEQPSTIAICLGRSA